MNHKKILKEVKTMLGMEVSLEQTKLDNGTVVEADEFAEGNEIFVVSEEERVPLPIGDYKLEDGRVLTVVKDGIIATIGTSEEEVEAEKEAVPAQDAPQLEEVTKPKKIVESVSKELFFAEMQKINDRLDELSKPKEVELKEVELKEVKQVKHSPEKNVKKDTFIGNESITEFLNKRK